MAGVNVLVIYYSRTGTTEKMAKAVAKGAKSVKEAKVTIKRVEEATMDDLKEADAIIIGSPTYYGQMAAEVKKFVDESVKIHGALEGKVGGAFTSCGAMGGGCETTILSILKAMLIHGMIIQGNPQDHHYGVVSIGAPDENVLGACKELGKRVAELAWRLKKNHSSLSPF
ncbi:MAG: NAD(P)H-dependent oxidoreductase [Thermoprotei archaeon]|nr:NAD(P)H-dependent oxidoreductase [Thermoprotei archaeon]